MEKSGLGFIGAVILTLTVNLLVDYTFSTDKSNNSSRQKTTSILDSYSQQNYREEQRKKSSLKTKAAQMSAGCPMMIDENTRLDKIIAVGTNGFQYNYTLLNYSKDSVGYEALQESLTPGLIEYIQNTVELKPYRDENFVFQYYYSDHSARPLFLLKITPDMYQTGFW